MQISELLPGARDAGTVRRWYLPLNNDGSSRASEIEYFMVHARFLGVGTAFTDRHINHTVNDRGEVAPFVRKGIRCNACRWFETRIFREVLLPDGVERLADVTDPSQVSLGDYVTHFAGMSTVDGEVPFCRYETTPSPHMVIESLTTRRTTGSGPVVYLAKPSAHALAAAAAFDDGLQEAYINRAVS